MYGESLPYGPHWAFGCDLVPGSHNEPHTTRPSAPWSPSGVRGAAPSSEEQNYSRFDISAYQMWQPNERGTHRVVWLCYLNL